MVAISSSSPQIVPLENREKENHSNIGKLHTLALIVYHFAIGVIQKALSIFSDSIISSWGLKGHKAHFLKGQAYLHETDINAKDEGEKTSSSDPRNSERAKPSQISMDDTFFSQAVIEVRESAEGIRARLIKEKHARKKRIEEEVEYALKQSLKVSARRRARHESTVS